MSEHPLASEKMETPTEISLEMCRLRPGWSVGRVFCPLVKCDGQCASASARGSQGL